MAISSLDKNDDRYDTKEEESIPSNEMKRILLALAAKPIRKPDIRRDFLFGKVFEWLR